MLACLNDKRVIQFSRIQKRKSEEECFFFICLTDTEKQMKNNRDFQQIVTPERCDTFFDPLARSPLQICADLQRYFQNVRGKKNPIVK